MRYKKRISVYLLCALFFLPINLWAENDGLPSNVFLVITLKALNYDRNIDRQSTDKITIGVVYINTDKSSEDFSHALERDFVPIESQSHIKNLPTMIKVWGVDKNLDDKALSAMLKNNHVSVIITVMEDARLNKLFFQTARALGINSIAYSAQAVQQGAGLGIILKDNRPRMLANLNAIKQEGSDYSAQFLSLCDIVG